MALTGASSRAIDSAAPPLHSAAPVAARGSRRSSVLNRHSHEIRYRPRALRRCEPATATLPTALAAMLPVLSHQPRPRTTFPYPGRMAGAAQFGPSARLGYVRPAWPEPEPSELPRREVPP